MSKKKVIIWTTGIDDLLEGQGQVGGLTVQMMFWAFAFKKNGFITYSFSNSSKRYFKGLNLLKFPQTKRFSIISESLFTIYYIIKVRPDIIIFRGASRTLFLLSYLSSIFKIKLVFMGASDVNFIPGKENIAGRGYNKFLFRKGLKKTKNIVVQNDQQAESLSDNYHKKSIVIPNIWSRNSNLKCDNDLIIWVGNFRRLKRPEWFIHLAQKFPSQDFVMAGFPNNKKLYESCLDLSKSITNLDFLGPITFEESEKLFDKAKLLVCTSEYEGFPNTFLQAWARNIPVLSTVDPSGLIAQKQLGIYVQDELQLNRQFENLISDHIQYTMINKNILNYFKNNHNPSLHLSRLLDYINS